MNVKILKAAFAGIVLFVSGFANAGLISIDFESDLVGNKGTTFTSVDSSLVVFSAVDSLSVGNFGVQSVGQGLAAFGTDAGLTMNFSIFVDSLSLMFGNDDPGFSETMAILTVFSGATQVGQTSLVYNKNDVADETIMINGVGSFDSATLIYESGTSGLAEVVDNIQFNTTNVTQVPEVGTLFLMVLGVLGFAIKRKAR